MPEGLHKSARAILPFIYTMEKLFTSKPVDKSRYSIQKSNFRNSCHFYSELSIRFTLHTKFEYHIYVCKYMYIRTCVKYGMHTQNNQLTDWCHCSHSYIEDANLLCLSDYSIGCFSMGIFYKNNCHIVIKIRNFLFENSDLSVPKVITKKASLSAIVLRKMFLELLHTWLSS